MVSLQQDTNYLDEGIPVGGSVIVNWNNRMIMIYHGTTGYYPTDISDLPPTTITELAKQTPTHGVLYYFFSQDTLKEAAESAISLGGTAAEISAAVAKAIGDAAAAAVNPLLGSLVVPLLLVVVGLYFVTKLKPI